jgi:oxygen-independent coproporphyrinogen-3 oxidase
VLWWRCDQEEKAFREAERREEENEVAGQSGNSSRSFFRDFKSVEKGESLREISLYIHIPFCLSKCPYCDFVSFSWKESKASSFLKFLKQEMALYSPSLKDFRVKTVYLGGGTPSLLREKEIDSLFSALSKYFNLDSKAEICIEANPESLERNKVRTWKRVGVNRVSLGVQSFDDKALCLLGRKHDSATARNAFSLLREEGFGNINFDLIFGFLPDENWEFTLEEAVHLEPEHISTYAFTLKEETPMYVKVKRGEIEIVNDEVQAERYEFTSDFLKRSGYFHYEISNFSKKGFQCLHNLSYWRNENYLGLGVGAHSHLEGRRFANHSSLEKYIEDLKEGKRPLAFEEKLTLEEELREKIIMNFRLSEGLEKRLIRSCGEKSLIFLQRIEKLKEKGLIEESEETYFIPEKYFFVSNSILREIV